MLRSVDFVSVAAFVFLLNCYLVLRVYLVVFSDPLDVVPEEALLEAAYYRAPIGVRQVLPRNPFRCCVQLLVVAGNKTIQGLLDLLKSLELCLLLHQLVKILIRSLMVEVFVLRVCFLGPSGLYFP